MTYQKTNPQDGAFACASDHGHQAGITKREYFAAMALQGIIAAHDIYQTGINHEVNALAAVKAADALINELNKEAQPCTCTQDETTGATQFPGEALRCNICGKDVKL